MICYFANRRMEILAHASTQLKKGLHIKDDKKVEDVDSGQDIFSGYLRYEGGQRALAENAVDVGNYILKKSDDTDELYTIIESESDPLHNEIYFYAEAAGLDLIGEVCEPFEATRLMLLSEYAEKWLYDTGFEIGVDESEGATKMLKWDDAETAMARILSTASQFGCEVSFRYSIKRFSIKHKYVNFHKKRGKENDDQLRRGRDFEDIRIRKSIADIATALRVTGGTPDGSGIRRNSDSTYTWIKFSEYSDGYDEENEASMQDENDGMHFIGISPGHATDEESDLPTDYTWGPIRKGTGYYVIQGTTGYRESKDYNGKARYTWIMFATDENGSNMSDYPTDRSYVGIAMHQYSQTKGALPSQYHWYPMDKKIADRNIFVNAAGGAIAEGGGLYTWVKFADDPSGSGMTNTAAGKSYIGIAEHQTSATESTRASDYVWQAITTNTTNGAFAAFNPGYCGLRHNSGYIWYRFAADAEGTNMAGTPNDRPYIGLAYDKTTAVQSSNPAFYEWDLIGVDEASEVTLKGMDYDDGDFWVDSQGRLRSETALVRWSRYISPDETGTDVGHILANFESDATSQDQLLDEAIAELKRRREPEITYEIELIRKPDWLEIGDTVPIVDPEGELFLTARLIKLERSAESGKYTAIFGDYIRKSASLSDQVAELAKKQREEAKAAKYQWVVYADSPTGDGIRLDPEEAMYMGVAYNKASPVPDLSDPFAYTWTQVGGADGANGQDGEDAVVLRLDSTRGLVFKNNWYYTQLRVTVIKGGESITDLQALQAQFGMGAYLQWYFRKQADQEWSTMSVSDSRITEGGFCLTVTPDDVDEQITFQCDLIG